MLRQINVMTWVIFRRSKLYVELRGLLTKYRLTKKIDEPEGDKPKKIALTYFPNVNVGIW